MKKLDRQFFQSILIVLICIIIFIIIIAGYLKIDEYRKLSYKVNTEFSSNDIIELNNNFPLSDEIGKSYSGTGMEKGLVGYSEFVVRNPNEKKVKFEIYITKMETEEDQIKSNYIKLYLTDDKNHPVDGFNTNVIKSYKDLYALKDKPGSKLVYRDTLVAGGSKKFILRSWVSDTYAISKQLKKFKYDIDVRIK